MKEKFKKGMALVLATAMLIPSAVSAQSAAKQPDIFDEMNKNIPTVGRIKIDGDVTLLEETGRQITEKIDKYSSTTYDEEKPYKTTFSGDIGFFTSKGTDMGNKDDMDLMYKFNIKSQSPKINKVLAYKNITNGSVYVRGDKMYVPSQIVLASLKSRIDEAKEGYDLSDEYDLQEYRDLGYHKYEKAYNDIIKGGYKYVLINSSNIPTSKDNQTIDRKQLETDMDKFMDRMEKEIYKDYKAVTPYTLNKNSANIVINKQQFINEIVNFVDYTVQRLDKIVQIFVDCFSKSISQFGKSEEVNEMKNSIKTNTEDNKEVIQTVRSWLEEALKDVEFNLNYNVQCVNSEKRIYKTELKLNIAIPTGESINLRITAGQQSESNMKLATVPNKAYDITKLISNFSI